MPFVYPDWISVVPGSENTFVVDPDVFYPAFFAEMGITPDKVTRYDIEVAMGCMKLDFDQWVRLSGAAKAGRIVRIVRSDEGRKMRWNLNLYPVGPVDWESLSLGERARRIREAHSTIRG